MSRRGGRWIETISKWRSAWSNRRRGRWRTRKICNNGRKRRRAGHDEQSYTSTGKSVSFHMKDTFQTGAGIFARRLSALITTCAPLQHCAAKRRLNFTDTNASLDTRIRLVEFLCVKRLVVLAHAGGSGIFCNCVLICVRLGRVAVCGILLTPASFNSHHRRRTWFAQVFRLRCSPWCASIRTQRNVEESYC